MYCRNCGNENPNGVWICEVCGADLKKRVEFTQPRTRRKRTMSFSSCLNNSFSYTIILILIVVTIYAVLVFNCKIEAPKPSKVNSSGIVYSILEEIEIMQADRCPE